MAVIDDMGCCDSKGGEKLAADTEYKPPVPKVNQPQNDQSVTDETPAAEKLPAPTALILHVNAESKPRFSQVFRVLAQNINIQQRETRDLATVKGVVIKRYPVAEINGKVMSGEKVIGRYLAQMQGLYPTGPAQVYLCESLIDQIEDMWKSLQKQDDSALYQAAELLQGIEKRLETRYFGGDKPGYADVVVFCFLVTFFLGEEVRVARAGAVPMKLQNLVTDLKTRPFFNPPRP